MYYSVTTRIFPEIKGCHIDCKLLLNCSTIFITQHWNVNFDVMNVVLLNNSAILDSCLGCVM